MKVTITSGNNVIETDITEEQAMELGLIKTGWERAEIAEKYYKISLDKMDDIGYDYDFYNRFNDRAFDNANYFTTVKLANKMMKRIRLMLRMQRWADNHNEPIDWNDGKEKWAIHYNTKNCKINTFSWLGEKGLFDVYFSNRELAEEAADIFGEEILEVMKNE